MNFAIIYTIIILLLSIPFFVTNIARIIPIGVRIFPFVAAISLLWLHTIFFRLKGRTGVLSAQNNYKVTLYCAGKDLQINLQDARAIGFASPVYAGLIRPPLENFIQRNEFSGIECFVALTGADKEGIEVDTSKTTKLIEEKGGKIIGKEKFITSYKEDELQEKIDLFSKELIGKL
ncbi:hypothetical protein ES705_40577 [subsurface metagenome]